MSSIILHSLIPMDDGGSQYEESYHAPASIARWVRPPIHFLHTGQIPAWANALVIDAAGQALPVIETPEEIAHLHAHALQSMWHSFSIQNGKIWMKRYDSEVGEVTK